MVNYKFFYAVILNIVLIILFCQTVAAADLNDSHVAAGHLKIQQEQNNLHVHQLSDKAILEWKHFSVPNDQHVYFEQPSVNASILNRINGNETSFITGNISANGQVFIVNPNGIVITPTAQIHAHSFIASQHNIKNSDFLKGKYFFENNAQQGLVANFGTINAATDGWVALLGANVLQAGKVLLAYDRVIIDNRPKILLNLSQGNLFAPIISTDKLESFDAVDNEGTQLISFPNQLAKEAIRQIINLDDQSTLELSNESQDRNISESTNKNKGDQNHHHKAINLTQNSVQRSAHELMPNSVLHSVSDSTPDPIQKNADFQKNDIQSTTDEVNARHHVNYQTEYQTHASQNMEANLVESKSKGKEEGKVENKAEIKAEANQKQLLNAINSEIKYNAKAISTEKSSAYEFFGFLQDKIVAVNHSAYLKSTIQPLYLAGLMFSIAKQFSAVKNRYEARALNSPLYAMSSAIGSNLGSSLIASTIVPFFFQTDKTDIVAAQTIPPQHLDHNYPIINAMEDIPLPIPVPINVTSNATLYDAPQSSSHLTIISLAADEMTNGVANEAALSIVPQIGAAGSYSARTDLTEVDLEMTMGAALNQTHQTTHGLAEPSLESTIVSNLLHDQAELNTVASLNNYTQSIIDAAAIVLSPPGQVNSPLREQVRTTNNRIDEANAARQMLDNFRRRHRSSPTRDQYQHIEPSASSAFERYSKTNSKPKTSSAAQVGENRHFGLNQSGLSQTNVADRRQSDRQQQPANVVSTHSFNNSPSVFNNASVADTPMDARTRALYARQSSGQPNAQSIYHSQPSMPLPFDLADTPIMAESPAVNGAQSSELLSTGNHYYQLQLPDVSENANVNSSVNFGENAGENIGVNTGENTSESAAASIAASVNADTLTEGSSTLNDGNRLSIGYLLNGPALPGPAPFVIPAMNQLPFAHPFSIENNPENQAQHVLQNNVGETQAMQQTSMAPNISHYSYNKPSQNMPLKKEKLPKKTQRHRFHPYQSQSNHPYPPHYSPHSLNPELSNIVLPFNAIAGSDRFDSNIESRIGSNPESDFETHNPSPSINHLLD